MKKNDYTQYLYFAPVFVLIVLIFIFPLCYSVILSFFEWNLTKPKQRGFVGFGNFVDTAEIVCPGDIEIFPKRSGAEFEHFAVILFAKRQRFGIPAVVGPVLGLSRGEEGRGGEHCKKDFFHFRSVIQFVRLGFPVALRLLSDHGLELLDRDGYLFVSEDAASVVRHDQVVLDADSSEVAVGVDARSARG